MTNIKVLKEILAVPTKYCREDKLIAWLSHYLTQKQLSHHIDNVGNVYVTKGELHNGERYPCVSAHIDTVHEPEEVQVVLDQERLIALDSKGRQTGLGGDDKSGVYICLELLDRLPLLKVAFFVSEEIGCQGSRKSDRKFFRDVGYVMQFDSPCDDIMTYTCDGTQLFPDHGEFHDLMLPIVKAHGVTNWQHHPYTDVSVLKRLFDFPCLNLPAGYFRMHSPQEYVLPAVVDNSIRLGLSLIQAFGPKGYHYVADRDVVSRPALAVTRLHCHG